MGLLPIQPIKLDDILVNGSNPTPIVQHQPSRTYELNFETGRIGGMIDGKAAKRQGIKKALRTPRYRYPIYDDQYGCELEELLAKSLPFELLKPELERVIREALIYDDRIRDVVDFSFSHEDSKLFIEFTVHFEDDTQLAYEEVKNYV